MTLLKWHPSAWLRDLTAIASTVLIASVPTAAIGANSGSETVSSSATTAVNTVSQVPVANLCPSDLTHTVDAIINRSQFASAQWGVLIEPMSEEDAIYTHAAGNMLIPASNIKLLTTAAALRIIADRSPQALPDFRAKLDVINRYSNNAQADQLLQTIGGQHAVQTALSPLGVQTDGYRQVDGSGLSRGNKAKPSTFVALLKAMHTTDESELFYNSLPVSGINGTLRNRFKGTPLQGQVHAKTGTLRGVRALSGYVETPAYGTVVFSIVVNQPGQSGGVMLAAIDEVVAAIARVHPCR
ncbi:MAG: D-alanyl-D-alanine carboxypeptidase [Cyanobacteria bacterium J06638_28]